MSAAAANAPDPVLKSDPANEDARWRSVSELACEVTVEVPLSGFRVEDFMKLQKGAIIPARWPVSSELPLRVNGTLIAWAELEASATRIAVRLTEVV